DNAPAEIVKGAIEALNQDEELSLILTGMEDKIQAELAKYRYDASRVEVVHCSEVIDMNDVPTEAVKKKKDSSLVKGMWMLKKDDSIGAIVTAGSTGAAIVGGQLIVGRIRGVNRAALCPSLPSKNGGMTLLCDSGANAECKPQMLCQFAVLASAYAKTTFGIANPTVGLLNNGTEEHKGDPVHQEAYHMMSGMSEINFVGNVEGREINYGDTDIVVADGFSGNTTLKGIEGCGKLVLDEIKAMFTSSLWSKLGYVLFLRKAVKGMRQKLDFERYGGAVLLGVKKVVVKTHGSSKAKSIVAAIKQAANAVRNDTVGAMERELASVDWEHLVHADGEN
ncbi:MAG: phosphate acyltransferase PlsX, partial [Christensenellaceae bacterium]